MAMEWSQIYLRMLENDAIALNIDWHDYTGAVSQ